MPNLILKGYGADQWIITRGFSGDGVLVVHHGVVRPLTELVQPITALVLPLGTYNNDWAAPVGATPITDLVTQID